MDDKNDPTTPLTEQQRVAMDALLVGKKQGEAAKIAGCSDRVIRKWMATIPWKLAWADAKGTVMAEARGVAARGLVEGANLLIKMMKEEWADLKPKERYDLISRLESLAGDDAEAITKVNNTLNVTKNVTEDWKTADVIDVDGKVTKAPEQKKDEDGEEA